MIDQIQLAKLAWDKNVPKEIITEYVYTVYGNESKYYAENWYPDDRYLVRYLHNIHRNQHNINGKRILEVGPGHGLWLLLCYLYGAKEVYGIEPRMHTKDGINQFYLNKNFTGKIYTGSDKDIPTICKDIEFDTVLLLDAFDHFQHQQTAMRSLMSFNPEAIWLEHYSFRKKDILQNYIEPMSAIDREKITGITLHRTSRDSSIKTGITPYESGSTSWVKSISCMDTVDQYMSLGGYEATFSQIVDYKQIDPKNAITEYTCYQPNQ